MEYDESFPHEAELESFFAGIKNYVLRSFQPSKGFAGFRFPDYTSLTAPGARPLALAASTIYPGQLIEGWEKEPGGKGGVALRAIAGSIGHWTDPQKEKFQRAMNAPKHFSLPAQVGREMGLLFEIEAFLYLVQKHGLTAIGGFDLQAGLAEQQRLEQQLNAKLSKSLTALVMEFIRIHAGGPPHGMGEMMYQKTVALIGRNCQVNAIEFTGGGGARYNRIKQDTADIRIGCDQFMQGQRSSIGWTMKAATEPEMSIRHLSMKKALQVLGGKKYWKQAVRMVKSTLDNPLMDPAEMRSDVIRTLVKLAQRRFAGNPTAFVRLLELLTTGGSDTLPAARNLARNLGGAGWSGAFGMDFGTGEGEGRKLSARLQANPTVTVDSNPTYMHITYRLPNKELAKGQKGTNFGTRLKFEPSTDLRTVEIWVNNMTALGGRGY